MQNVTDEQVMRSIATAAMLILHGKTPEDFPDYENLPTNDSKRAIVSFKGQDLPVTFGPQGSWLAPSLMLEYGAAGNERGIIDRPVILSMSRLAKENSIERELMHIGEHSALLRGFVYGDPTTNVAQAPVYTFEKNLPTSIVGLVVWAAPALRNLPRPFDRTILGIDVGGWLKKEWHFTAHYQLK